MKRILPFLLILAACQQHTCPPPTKIITHYDTVERQRIDTLVIIQSYDSIPKPADNIWLRSGGYEMRPEPLFRDGKRADTIYRNTIIYY